MSWLIIPVTVLLLRGAFAVLLLAGAEAIGGEYLSARVRRILWIMCIFLMMIPQPDFSFQPFLLDLTAYKEYVIGVADIIPRRIAELAGNIEIAYAIMDYSQKLTGLSYHNYPYLLGLILMIVPAVIILIVSYLRCRKRTNRFSPVTDPVINRIWIEVADNAKNLPILLDSGEDAHPPVLFGFFRQKLLLPVRYLQTLSEKEIKLLLTHELVHYQSFDGIINILTLFFWPFCWYNPFFLAARKRLRINCELACDAEVLKRYPDSTIEYGKLLLSFANTCKPPEVTMAFREYSGELRSRIVYISGLAHRRKSSLFASAGLALSLIAPFMLVSAIPHHIQEQNIAQVLTVAGQDLQEQGNGSSFSLENLSGSGVSPLIRSVSPDNNHPVFEQFRNYGHFHQVSPAARFFLYLPESGTPDLSSSQD